MKFETSLSSASGSVSCGVASLAMVFAMVAIIP